MFVTYLPGLHGTNDLYPPLVENIPHEQECLEIPQDSDQDYDALELYFEQSIDWSVPRHLVAESFSGPLAVRLGKNHPESVRSVTLAATFSASPFSSNLALLPLRPLLMISPPATAIRHFLAEEDTNSKLIEKLRATLGNIPSPVLTARVRTVLKLSSSDCPSLPETPMLILQAKQDNLIPWESQNHLEHHYPHAEIHWMDAPHLLFQTHPQKAAQHIKTFLEKH